MRALLACLLLWPTLAWAQPSMRAADWVFGYSPSMPAHPTQAVKGWRFAFPAYTGKLPCRAKDACPSVHMLTVPVAGIKGRSITVTGRIVTSGPVQFSYRTEPANTCISPFAIAHLYIERAIDFSDYGRFWSTPLHIDLKAGAFSVTVNLNSANWTSVFGHRNAGRFADTLAHARRIGLTFGGGCFFGHGVNVRGGTARFVVTKYAINP